MNVSSDHSCLRKRLAGRNLYLVGMMGSGKSHTGPFLAKFLQYGYVDSDSVIEGVARKTIKQIFEIDGENDFREIETQVLSAIGQRHSLVVATGGGVVLRPENWGVLHQGIVVWIDPGYQRLWDRLQLDDSHRPLLNTKNSFEDFQSIFSKRQPLYAEADLHISVSDETPEVVALKILEKIPSILIPQEGSGV